MMRVKSVHLSYRNAFRYKLRTFSTQAVEPKPFKTMPGPSEWPVVGSLHHFLPGIGSIGPPENFISMTETFYKKFGPVVKFNLFTRATMVLLFEPDDYDQVYRAEDATNTPLRPGFDTQVHYRTILRKDIFEGVHGLTTAQGPQWRDFRTKVNPALLKIKLVKLYAPVLDQIGQEMTERLIKLDSKYLDWNFDIEMTKFSLESVALVGLGARLGCLDAELTEDHPARKLMTSAKEVLECSFKLELAPVQFWRYFSTPSHKKLINAFDTQWNLSAMYIDQARKAINERGCDVPDEDKSIIEKLLAIDEKVAIMMANEMLLAGIDTVAFASTSVLYELAKNPHVQDKLREEIRSGDSNKRYLKACVKEALRLHPVIAANLRRTSKEHFVAGYRIPEGVDVVAPNEYLCRKDKYFPRALEFIPERWLVDKHDPLYYGNSHPMVYLPFGFGIRMCIGRRIAELEIEALVQGMVGNYIVKWEGPPIKVKTMVMNSYVKPYHFRFEAAK